MRLANGKGLEVLRQVPGLFSPRRCVFVVGAGISVPSGIPDFRSPSGIFSELRKQLRIDGRSLFTYNFGREKETSRVYLKYIADLKRLCDRSAPNEVHQFLAGFPSSRTYTQNIDGLERRAGMAFERDLKTRGVYLHGNLESLVCDYCGFRQPFGTRAQKMFEEGSEVECEACVGRQKQYAEIGRRKRTLGIMRPEIVHYHQAHPDGSFIGSVAEHDKDCDMLVVIGTSLKVDGVKRLVRLFARSPRAAGKRILVNKTPLGKQWEDCFDYFFEGDCVDFVREYLVARKEWQAANKSLSNGEILAKLQMASREKKSSKTCPAAGEIARDSACTLCSETYRGRQVMKNEHSCDGTTRAASNQSPVFRETKEVGCECGNIKDNKLSIRSDTDGNQKCALRDSRQDVIGPLRRLSLISSSDLDEISDRGCIIYSEEEERKEPTGDTRRGSGRSPKVSLCSAKETTKREVLREGCVADSVAKSESETCRERLLFKLERISEMFDTPDLIASSVLDDALKDAVPSKIRRGSISDSEYVGSLSSNSSTITPEDELKSMQRGADASKSRYSPGFSPVPKKRGKKPQNGTT